VQNITYAMGKKTNAIIKRKISALNVNEITKLMQTKKIHYKPRAVSGPKTFIPTHPELRSLYGISMWHQICKFSSGLYKITI